LQQADSFKRESLYSPKNAAIAEAFTLLPFVTVLLILDRNAGERGCSGKGSRNRQKPLN
jgi:hypothetical protein